MQVRINGKPEEIQNGTVLELLKTKNIEPQMVAVESTTRCWIALFAQPTSMRETM